MKAPTLRLLSVLAIVLLMFDSCKQRTDDSINLGLIRIVPENISVRDSANTLINPGVSRDQDRLYN